MSESSRAVPRASDPMSNTPITLSSLVSVRSNSASRESWGGVGNWSWWLYGIRSSIMLHRLSGLAYHGDEDLQVRLKGRADRVRHGLISGGGTVKNVVS